MKTKRHTLNEILDNCPKMVPVFMVIDGAPGVRGGDIVYWDWVGTFRSHYRDVTTEISNLDFLGYAPILNLDDHPWPNMRELMHREDIS